MGNKPNNPSGKFGVVKLPTMMVITWDGDIQAIDRKHAKFAEIEAAVDKLAKARKPNQPWAISKDQWLALKRHVDYQEAVKHAVKKSNVQGVELSPTGAVLVDGKPVSGRLGDVLGTCLRGNTKDLGKFVAFARSLEKASDSAKKNLFNFIEKQGIAVDDAGNVLALKIVDSNFKDLYTHKLDNTPGRTVAMNRSKVVEDSSRECAAGLHVCSPGYLHAYGSSTCPTVLVKVAPCDFVSVPSDYNFNKARVEKYVVLQNLGTRKEVQAMGSTMEVILKKVDAKKHAPLLKVVSYEGAPTVTSKQLLGKGDLVWPTKETEKVKPTEKASVHVKPAPVKKVGFAAKLAAYKAAPANKRHALAEELVALRKKARKSWQALGVNSVLAGAIEMLASKPTTPTPQPARVAVKKVAPPAKKAAKTVAKKPQPATPDQRKKAAQDIRAGRKTVKEVAAQYGVTTRAVNYWVSR